MAHRFVTVVTPGETLKEATRRIAEADCVTFPEAKREALRQIAQHRLLSATTVDELKPVLSYILSELER